MVVRIILSRFKCHSLPFGVEDCVQELPTIVNGVSNKFYYIGNVKLRAVAQSGWRRFVSRKVVSYRRAVVIFISNANLCRFFEVAGMANLNLWG